jgi:hypothetical protein
MCKKRFVSGIFFSLLISCFAWTNAIAQPIVQEQTRLSKLTLTAFDCSLLATDGKEAQRLLEVGFTAGRSFLSGINNLSKAERSKLSGQIDSPWHRVWDGKSQSVVAKPPTEALGQTLWGPTVDFILGRVLSDRAARINNVISDKDNDESAKNSIMTSVYREQKCSLTQYHRSEHSNPPTYHRSWHSG